MGMGEEEIGRVSKRFDSCDRVETSEECEVSWRVGMCLDPLNVRQGIETGQCCGCKTLPCLSGSTECSSGH